MRSNTEQAPAVAVIFGSHFNAYSILQELSELGVEETILLYSNKGLAAYSNIPIRKILIKEDYEEYYNALLDLSLEYKKVILFPTDDQHLEFFYQYFERLSEFCYIPLNPDTYLKAVDKYEQYKVCEQLHIPYPRTIIISSKTEIVKVLDIPFPLIIKPVQREDTKLNIFRNLVLNDIQSFKNAENLLFDALDKGVHLISSELIPGDTNGTIYAYCAFRSPITGKVLNHWTGKKLSQHPNDYGVFSSASNEAPGIVKTQGEQLIEELDLYGFVEPEFKFDERDGKYKLMEINLRPMMWNRTGTLSGVNLHYTEWLDALNQPIVSYQQNNFEAIHFYYLRHEINNLVNRPKYHQVFRRNLFGGKRNYMAIFNIRDVKPFFFDLLVTVKNLFKRK